MIFIEMIRGKYFIFIEININRFLNKLTRANISQLMQTR